MPAEPAVRLAPAAGAAAVGRRPGPWVALAVICLGFFLILLDTTIVNIALPAIMAGLPASLDQVLWVVNAYMLVFAVLLVPAGRLGDVLGHRRVFMLGLVAFTLASALCGLTADAAQLIAARALQGVGAAMLFPQALALITTIFPSERRGLALGAFGGVNGIALISGPIVGGVVLGHAGWRWIFELNVPVGAVALAAAALVLPHTRPGRRAALDPVGVLLVGAGLLGVVFGLLEGQRYRWGAVAGWVGIPEVIAAGAVTLGVFAAWELRHRRGLLPLELLRIRDYALGNWIALCVQFAMLGAFLPLVLFFQVVAGMSPLRTALALTPIFAGMMVAAPAAGRLSDVLGGKPLVLAGSLVSAAGFGVVVLRCGAGAPVGDLVLPLLATGLGLGFTVTPLFALTMADIPAELAGTVSGFLSAVRTLGQVLGIAVVGGVLQSRLAAAAGYGDAIRAALVVCVAVTLLAAACTLFLESHRRRLGWRVDRGRRSHQAR